MDGTISLQGSFPCKWDGSGWGWRSSRSAWRRSWISDSSAGEAGTEPSPAEATSSHEEGCKGRPPAEPSGGTGEELASRGPDPVAANSRPDDTYDWRADAKKRGLQIGAMHRVIERQWHVYRTMLDAGLTNAEEISKKIKSAFVEHAGWKQSEKELRELRKKVTFAIFSQEDDLNKVTAMVDELFTLLSKADRI